MNLVLCRAEQWDLANPMITGVLQVYQKDLELYLRVFEPKRKQDDVMVLGLADMVRQTQSNRSNIPHCMPIAIIHRKRGLETCAAWSNAHHLRIAYEA